MASPTGPLSPSAILSVVVACERTWNSFSTSNLFHIQGKCDCGASQTIFRAGSVGSRHPPASNHTGNDMGRWVGCLQGPQRAFRRFGGPKERLGVKVCISLLAEANPNSRFCPRAEALQLFKKHPFFTSWDPLSLELYVECQLWEDKETGKAKLKMSGIWVGGHLSF